MRIEERFMKSPAPTDEKILAILLGIYTRLAYIMVLIAIIVGMLVTEGITS